MLKKAKQTRVFQVIQAYGVTQASNYATSLAFSAFLTMFPLILGILAIVGMFIQNPSTEASVYSGIVSIFPADAHTALRDALNGAKHHAGLLGIVSLLGLLWGGTSLFASLEFSLTKIFGSKQRSMLRQRLMGLVMVVVFVVAVLLSVLVNSLTASAPLSLVVGPIIGGLVLVALLTVIYRFVPNRTFSTREVLPGALVAGVLIELFSLFFKLYAQVSKGFGSYGQQFALFFLLAAWLGVLSQLLLLGAVYNKVRLGTPEKEGIIPSEEKDSREHVELGEGVSLHGTSSREVAPPVETPAVEVPPKGNIDKEAEMASQVFAAGITALVISVVARIRGRNHLSR